MMYEPVKTSKAGFVDVEAGAGLYPGISSDENTLRWGFIRKVYGIVSTQLLLSMIVAAVVVFNTPVSLFFAQMPGLYFFMSFLPLILLIPLYYYQQKHPVNLVLLGFFTVSLSLTVGVSCAFTRGELVLEALVLTATVTLGLTAYTYWASKKGYDFNFLGPVLFVAVITLILWSLIQVFFPASKLSMSIYGGIATVIFSAYIVYDTDNLIKRFNYDEYIWASVSLYLDILNLFLSILNILRAQSN
ncbi:hypothetical protein O6H91_09G069700 [Diphasiastrum complanatum]|uniref:Uncharacterized protein n=4 Tax=Diphasiastrum complanatum TaxID=34168 RepID=A0ACC2CQG5_DIPCM|nr:hypothetical protein O6H91_09G069700 [Diphasiastrum complanatum]KAJ7544207.1 hypothetical protein O6H91_09G069700 [Diphasiastrum complanatum]KAJ7544208.1 hypothetical protein O6H91_09G069700 [Diphasiastrum complanatum]KAJ7544209.1 hypothetical protein O6H91_09G069700 [Diphasiastrum complanatum]